MNTVNPYETLKAHVEKHRYTRGINKGEAPLDPKRRRRDWERVVLHPDKITIHRYHTDIVTVYPDGRVVLDFDGWESCTTTRVCATVALYLMGIRASVGSVRYKNLSQVCINLPSGTYKYYDGMELVQQDGRWVVAEPKQFLSRVRDTEKTSAFNEALKFSGFKNLFPLLYVNSESGDPSYTNNPTRLHEILTNPACAEFWPSIVTAVKWTHSSHYDRNQGRLIHTYEARTVSKAWAALTNNIKKDMTKTVKTDTTVL